MTHVICEPCVGVKDRSCVDVCPVDCIHTDENSPQLYIHPLDCIDCTLCVEACPVDACLHEDDVPPLWKSSIEANRKFFKL